MTPEERSLIDDLFGRLQQSEAQPRDPDAERLIRDRLTAQPAAGYYMAQSVLVQQQALTAAQQRIDDLERQLREARQQQQAPRPTSFLGGLFGSGPAPRPAPPPQPTAYAPPPAGPWGAPPPPSAGYGYSPQPQQPYPPPRFGNGFGSGFAGGGPAGGGFLAGAAQTAAGVAGGILAAEAIGSLLHHSPGPFASAGFGGDHGGAQPVVSETVINNYYGDRPDARDAGGGDGGGPPDAWTADATPDDRTYDSGGFDSSDFGGSDSGGSGSGGGDDE